MHIGHVWTYLKKVGLCLLRKCEVPRIVQGGIPEGAVTVVRKSFDARKRLKWVYIVDVDTAALTTAGVRNPQRHPQLKERCCTDHDNQPCFDNIVIICQSLVLQLN